MCLFDFFRKSRVFSVKRKNVRVKGATKKLDQRLLRFAAFNIQIFGDAKIADEFVREKLIEIFTKVRVLIPLSSIVVTIFQFDIIVVQEIRDSNGDAFPYFVGELNKKCDRYDFCVGHRQGRSTSKEQYGLVWNRNKLECLDSFNYDDGCEKKVSLSSYL